MTTTTAAPPNLVAPPPAAPATAANAVPPAGPAPTPVPQATPAEPAGPAVPTVLQAQGNPVPEESVSLNNFDVSTIQDPMLRSMATIMQTVGKGIDMDRVLGKALDRADPSLIDLAYLKEKSGANYEQLRQIAEGLVQGAAAQGEAAVQSVYALAGGKDQWAAHAAAFNKSAPPSMVNAVAKMLNSGDAEQIKAGAEIVVHLSKASGIVPNNNGTVQTGAGLSAAQALSKEAFQAEVRKLDVNSRTYRTDYAALVQRRTLGKSLGQ